MKKSFLLFLVISIGTSHCFSQTKNHFVPFDSKLYPSLQYEIKNQNFKLNELKIQLIQVHDKDYVANQKFACRAWLNVYRNKKIISQKYFDNMEAVGGCCGIYVNGSQFDSIHVIASKYGDYDGSILIVDTCGEIHESIGGDYFFSSNKKYLFSIYDSDLQGFSVFDLKDNRFISKTIVNDSLAIFEWYFQNNNYYALLESEEVIRETNDSVFHKQYVYVFNFSKRKFLPTKTPATDLKSKNRIPIMYGYDEKNGCNCN